MDRSLVETIRRSRTGSCLIQIVTAMADRRTLSVDELYEMASRRLAFLHSKGLGEGGYCILYLYDELACLETFWACLMGGIIAVPIAPGQRTDHKQKLLEVAAQLDNPTVIAEDEAMDRLLEYIEETGRSSDGLEARVYSYSPLPETAPRSEPLERSPEDIAFIQFSSGSTRSPKGIVLTHGNLLANIDDISVRMQLRDDSVALSWMPLTHDMGMIGFHLVPIYAGIDQYIMRTSMFVRRPLAWLELAAEVGATHIASPNFGYRHWMKARAKSGEQGHFPDLSRVRQILNGAEPIWPELAENFMETLAPSGLAAGAMSPCYGLAEATLAVCSAEVGEGIRTVSVDRTALKIGDPVKLTEPNETNSIRFAIEGKIFPRTNARIATENGASLEKGVLGEIQVSGASVTSGYIGNLEVNSEVFTPDGWLRTGDLGFFHGDELVVTGRTKDTIVHEGQNYFAHDLEALTESLGIAETGEVAAAALQRQGGDAFVLFIRTKDTGDTFANRATAARKSIFEHMGLTLADVVPVRTLPKTTSGKVRRAALAAEYEAGAFAPVVVAAAPTTIKDTQPMGQASAQNTAELLCSKLAALMDAEQIDSSSLSARSNFFEIGVTSLIVTELTEDINELYPAVLEVTDFFEYETIGDMADEIDRRRLEIS